MNARVRRQEGINLLGLMRREVVGNDVDAFANRLVGHDVGEEGDEFGRSMALCGSAQHFAGLGIECRVQRQCAMAEVFKAVALGAPGDSGSTGSLRSSAWIAVFSSTLNTAACWGGFRYTPVISAALVSKSGSLEAM